MFVSVGEEAYVFLDLRDIRSKKFMPMHLSRLLIFVTSRINHDAWLASDKFIGLDGSLGVN